MASKKPSGKSKRGTGGRRGASKTKDDTVETRTGAGPQYALPEGPRISHHLANVEAWEKKLGDLKLHVKKAYQAAAAEHITKGLLDELRGLKAGDPAKARQRFESLGIGLKAIGAQFQLNVFDRMYESDVDQARVEARAHVAAGRSMECRFADGEAHEAYIEEFMFQTAKLAPGMQGKSDDEIREAIAKDKVVPIGKGKAEDRVH